MILMHKHIKNINIKKHDDNETKKKKIKVTNQSISIRLMREKNRFMKAKTENIIETDARLTDGRVSEGPRRVCGP